MLVVTNVSYRFNINDSNTSVMQARRGFRQGDPLSPLLFVILMEYMNILLFRMQTNPDFNHHSKCENLSITDLAFADDVLLFSRGDYRFVELLIETFGQFSKMTGLIVNPIKCKVYFGGVDNNTRGKILRLTRFE
ncbi:unnamed protein product [Lathyrus sativus]|nr:unnamed protein product [Lathyrus sativus]